MKSKSETGHAKNVSNFEQLLAFVNGFGEGYKPSKFRIQPQALQELLLQARNDLDTVTQQLNSHKTAVNSRINAFKDLPALASRIVNAVAASDASDETKANAKSILRKLKGITITKKDEISALKEDATTEPVTEPTSDETTETPAPSPDNTAENDENKAPRKRSSAQTSRDMQIENFKLLFALIQNESNYQPNEEDLKVQTLQTYLNTLRYTNSIVINAIVSLSNARLQRNATLYGKKTGICDIAQDVKLYTKSAFGTSSPQYKQISKLRFTRH